MILDQVMNGSIESMTCQEHKQSIKCLRKIIEKIIPEVSNLKALISELSTHLLYVDYDKINKLRQVKELNELLECRKSDRMSMTVQNDSFKNSLLNGTNSLIERMNELDIQNEIIVEKNANSINGTKETTQRYFKAIFQDPLPSAPLMINPGFSINSALKKPVIDKRPVPRSNILDMDIVQSDDEEIKPAPVLRKSASVTAKINRLPVPRNLMNGTDSEFKKLKREKKKKKEKIVVPVLKNPSPAPGRIVQISSSENDLPASIRPLELQNKLKNKSVFFEKQKEQFVAINQIKIPLKRNFLNFDNSSLLFNEFVSKISLSFEMSLNGTTTLDSSICTISHQVSANYEWKLNKLELIPAGDVSIPPNVKINKFVPNGWLNPILSRLLDFKQTTKSFPFEPTDGKVTVCLLDPFELISNSQMSAVATIGTTTLIFSDSSNPLLVNNIIIQNSTKSSCYLFIVEENVHVTMENSKFVGFNQIVDKILGLPFFQKDMAVLDKKLEFLPNTAKSVTFDCNLSNMPVSQFLMNLYGLETIYYKGNINKCDINVVDYAAFDYLMGYWNIGQVMMDAIIIVIYNSMDFEVLYFNKEEIIYYIDDYFICEDVECIVEMLEQVENVVLCGNTWFDYFESCGVDCIHEAMSIESLMKSNYCRDTNNTGYKQIRYIYKTAPTQVPLVMNYSLDDLFVNSGIYDL